MNSSYSELTLESLASRISQLELEQDLRRKNIAWLKQYFDELKHEFNNRPELDQIALILQNIAFLTTRIAEVKPYLTHLSNISQDLDNSQVSTENVNLDDAEVMEQFEQQEIQIDIGLPVINSENFELAENEQEKKNYVVDEDTENSTAFRDLEFKIERVMWLVNRIYAAEEDSYNFPINAEEFWQLYKSGKRDFTGINLAGVDFSGTSLADGVNLSQANLANANLTKVDWRKVNLSGANLRGADISEAKLSQANLSEAKLDEAYFYKTQLESANLEKATLVKSNLSRVDLNAAYLREANLQEANLSSSQLHGGVNLSMANLQGVNLSGANMRKANLMRADLSNANMSHVNLLEANLEGAKLQEANLKEANFSGAIMPDGTTHD